MSVSRKCRGTAARYQKLAEFAEHAEVRRSYRELQLLWLQLAALSDQLDPGCGLDKGAPRDPLAADRKWH